MRLVPWDCPSCGRHYERITVSCIGKKKHCQAPGCKDAHQKKLNSIRKLKKNKIGGDNDWS